MFKPTLFVDIGATGAFFTLRQTYLHERHVPGAGALGNAVVNGIYQGTVEREVRSFHHFNLANTAAEAWEKARAAAEQMGLPLEGAQDELGEKLRKIQRATADELAAREARYEAMRAEWAAKRAAEGEQWRKDNADLVEALEAWRDTGTDSFLDSMAGALREYGSLTEGQTRGARIALERLATAARSRHVGEIGKRVVMQLTVDRVLDWSYGQFPTIYRYCSIARDADGNVIQYVGSRPLGDGTYKVTIKGHDEYRGTKQTIVQRPAPVEIAAAA